MSYSRKVPFVYADTYSCVYPAVDSCTDGDKTSVTESLDQLKNEINQECSGKTNELHRQPVDLLARPPARINRDQWVVELAAFFLEHPITFK